MKPQDILFLIVLFTLVWKRNPALASAFGLISLVTAFPLFSVQVFFTAQRLTWYAAAFFLVALVLIVLKEKSR